METELIKAIAPFGPEWLVGAAFLGIVFYFGREWLLEVKEQNKRGAELDLKREERKNQEMLERIKRDRERAVMEGQMVTEMGRSNDLLADVKVVMETIVTSNEILHSDLAASKARSQGMAEKVDHVVDRVDLMYEMTVK